MDKAESKNEKLTFPMYLHTKYGTVEVVGYAPENPEDCIAWKGYVSGDIVFRFYKTRPKEIKTLIPYCFPKDGKLEFFCPSGLDDAAENFSVKKLIDISFTRIVNETNGDENLYDEDILNDMMTARSTYRPVINQDDDCLKKLIKYVILKKNVDINRYKSTLDTPYALTNMKSALISKTKMSITYFLMWVELLDIDFKILIEDSGKDKLTPLKESILYESTSNSSFDFENGEYIPCLINASDGEKIALKKLHKLPENGTLEDDK